MEVALNYQVSSKYIMTYIDEKFKDADPVFTVERIQNILDDLGISYYEIWHDSGLDNCYSLSVKSNNGVPSANGKGVSKEFARASAYGEFIERIQVGLFLYKYQSIIRNDAANIHAFAPDAMYMDVDELIQNGEWMDHIIHSYGSKILTRESIAELCRVYACADDGKILTVPFYSVFEDRYVYLPTAFIDQMYTTNGVCAGNTREEAWIHAMSEIMERHSAIKKIVSGSPSPRISDETLKKYSTVYNIINQIRETGKYDVQVFDYSIGNGFPIVSTRIIDKDTQCYRVDVAADPVFEIALQRSLTELLQSHNIEKITVSHNGKILKNVNEFPTIINVINQLETGSGMYTAEYFADEISCSSEATVFPDHSNKSNFELCAYMFDLYRKIGKPLYIRNYSYLGFPSYRFIVPGFSETRYMRLFDMIPDYALADSVSSTYRNIHDATKDELHWLINYSDILKNNFGRYNDFGRISGVPLSGARSRELAHITRSYAYYCVQDYKSAADHIPTLNSDEDNSYFKCFKRYLMMKEEGIPEDQIRSILYKFFRSQYVNMLYSKLDNGATPYDDYLIQCNYTDCDKCLYNNNCSYSLIVDMISKLGKIYSKFTDGQKKCNFL